MMSKVEKLEDLVRIQTSDGNWNYDAYMHGMANGMILMLATMKDEEPAFLCAPKQWLSDGASKPTLPQETLEALDKFEEMHITSEDNKNEK